MSDIVKHWLRSWAKPYSWNDGTATKTITEQRAAAEAVLAMPKSDVAAYPIHPSCDEGQSGVIVAAHLTDEQMRGIPFLIACEMLDALANVADISDFGMEREVKRQKVIESYGPDLAELICQGIDEAMGGARRGYKRLCEWNDDSKKVGPLDSTEFDEPCYESCTADDEHAMPTTEFDFCDAVNAAEELIEQRDRAARLARKGLAA